MRCVETDTDWPQQSQRKNWWRTQTEKTPTTTTRSRPKTTTRRTRRWCRKATETREQLEAEAGKLDDDKKENGNKVTGDKGTIWEELTTTVTRKQL